MKNQFRKRGFALVVTLTLMVLLSILAIGMLSLSTVSLRATSASEPMEIARANARMAMMLALGELQLASGDDRRVTADGSIYTGAAHPNAVGVWKSWSPRLAENPTGATPEYVSPKTQTGTDLSAATSGFLQWLVSSPAPEELRKADWAKSGSLSAPVDLFATDTDGFRLRASKVTIKARNEVTGSYAWAVSQAATKAKINVSGPEENQRIANDGLQAQTRPTLELTDRFNQPAGDWNERAAKVVSISQAELDPALWIDGESVKGGADFTAQGYGVLSDVVRGGLKTDLSLGFEMSDADFALSEWGTVENPFHSENAPILVPAAYGNQLPLFAPVSPTGTFQADLNFSPANVRFDFPVKAAPTFETLRSFYRTPFHLYQTADGPTVFQRSWDNISLKKSSVPGGSFPPPSKYPDGTATQAGYMPVMDRVVFLLSVGLGANDEVRLVCTPLVTLWNPYNVALEIEGAVAYPWVDLPFTMDWRFINAVGTAEGNRNMYLSGIMGEQFREQGHGRSVNPFFYAAITADGSAISGSPAPIRFQPGEVRLFTPASNTRTEFVVNAGIRQRTVFLRPVSDISQLNTKGGLNIPMRNPVRNIGFTRVMKTGEKVSVSFNPNGGEDYPFFIGLEDANLAKGGSPSINDGGKVIADVLSRFFSQTGTIQSLVSPQFTYAQLKTEPVPIGVVETYHRVAKSGTDAQISDLVYTGNPRQGWMTSYITDTGFTTGPQYHVRMRPASSFNGVMQTENGGRNAFYGATQSSGSGRTHLPFFEVPRAAPLSLAAFQNADLTATPFSPAHQFANSWASAYVRRDKASDGNLNTDTVYLANEALWDGFFFSGAASTVTPASSGGSNAVWASTVANVNRSASQVVEDFVKNPDEFPLRNPRMRLHRGTLTGQELTDALKRPEGAARIAGHLLYDGSFNVNSTSVEAWTAFLGGMRGQLFDVEGGAAQSGDSTSFPRFRHPSGSDSDVWNGFRALSDDQVKTLATNIVAEVRKRGPFLSLAEFVNRRVEDSDLGTKGAIQAAIDVTDFNQSAMFDSFSTSKYKAESKDNISPANTGVGIPGYLTQADVLQSIAPAMTVRSDTFTIRGYGEARDKEGGIAAIARCEMIVQRVPEFVDSTDPPHTPIAETKPANQTFGRKFTIVSFRYLDNSEVGL